MKCQKKDLFFVKSKQIQVECNEKRFEKDW